MPIPESLRSEIEEWCQGIDGEIMFPNATGGLLSRSSDVVRDMLDQARQATGIRNLTFRQCRTTFATLYDGDPKDRQAILGHHNQQFTMRVYQKPIAARQQASVEDLDSRLAGKVVEMPKRESA